MEFKISGIFSAPRIRGTRRTVDRLIQPFASVAMHVVARVIVRVYYRPSIFQYKLPDMCPKSASVEPSKVLRWTAVIYYMVLTPRASRYVHPIRVWLCNTTMHIFVTIPRTTVHSSGAQYSALIQSTVIVYYYTNYKALIFVS